MDEQQQQQHLSLLRVQKVQVGVRKGVVIQQQYQVREPMLLLVKKQSTISAVSVLLLGSIHLLFVINILLNEGCCCSIFIYDTSRRCSCRYSYSDYTGVHGFIIDRTITTRRRRSIGSLDSNHFRNERLNSIGQVTTTNVNNVCSLRIVSLEGFTSTIAKTKTKTCLAATRKNTQRQSQSVGGKSIKNKSKSKNSNNNNNNNNQRGKSSAVSKKRRETSIDIQVDTEPERQGNPMSSSSSSSSSIQKTKLKSTAPPWQVLGTKDAKVNVKREIIRRTLIQQGIVPTHSSVVGMVPTTSTTSITPTTPISDQQSIVVVENKLSKTLLDPTTRRFLKWKRFNPSTAISTQKLVGSYLDYSTTTSSSSTSTMYQQHKSSLSSLPALGVPEIAFLGRSNVGKSSLLNKLTKMSSSLSSQQQQQQQQQQLQQLTQIQQRSNDRSTSSNNNKVDLARVGKTPGATASVNLYCLYDTKGRELLGFVDLPGFGYAKLSKHVQVAVQTTAEQYLNTRQQLALGIVLVDIRRIEAKDSTDDYSIIEALLGMSIPVIVVATKIDKIKSKIERERCLNAIRTNLDLPIGQPLCISSTTSEGIRDLWQIILEQCEITVQDLNSKYEGSTSTSTSTTNEAEEDEDNENDDDSTNDARENPWYKDQYTNKDDANGNLNNNNNNDDDDDDIDYDQQYDWSDDSDDFDHEEQTFDNNDNSINYDTDTFNDEQQQQQQQQQQMNDGLIKKPKRRRRMRIMKRSVSK